MTEPTWEPVSDVNMVDNGSMQNIDPWQIDVGGMLSPVESWKMLTTGGGGGGGGGGGDDVWPSQPMVGTYDGNPAANPPGEEKTLNTFGTYPAIASSYYPLNRINQSAERNRANKGIWACIDYQTRNTSSPNQWLLDMANGSGTGYSNMQQYIDDLLLLDQTHQAAGTRIVAALESEFENLWHNGGYLPSVTPAVFAAAESRFWSELGQASSRIIKAYWLGYYNLNGSHQDDAAQVDRIVPMFTSHPDIVMIDPYTESAGQTFTSLVMKYINQVKAMPWWQARPHIKFAVSETSIHSGRTDADGAVFYANWHQQMANMRAGGTDIKFAICFNRNAGIAQEITRAQHPNACNAFAASLAGA